MINKNIHIGIVGAGRIGTAIYELLVGSQVFDLPTSESYKVSIADIELKSHQNNFVKLDPNLQSNAQFNDFVKDKTLIINALPYTQNIKLYQSCLENACPYFDLSEDEGLDQYIKTLWDTEGMELWGANVPFTMPHCGLAPGMSTVIASSMIDGMNELQEIKIRVGALSQDATNQLKYHSSWSGDGLVNEYIGNCQVVQNGTFGHVSALSDYETITINSQDYEAFNTSGGIGTFAKTLAGLHPFLNANYKTLRRKGHYQFVDFLFNDLKLPQDLLTDIFKKYIPTTRKDVVILYVIVRGLISNESIERTYFKEFKPQTIIGRNMTAIEYTTAIGLLVMVELFLKEKLPSEGYVKQESVSLSEIYNTTFGRFYKEG